MNASNVPGPGLGMILVKTERREGETLSSRIENLMGQKDM